MTLPECQSALDNCQAVAAHATQQIVAVAALRPAAGQHPEAIEALENIAKDAMGKRDVLVHLMKSYRAERGQG